jgi:high affinity Mn2+ porin
MLACNEDDAGRMTGAGLKYRVSLLAALVATASTAASPAVRADDIGGRGAFYFGGHAGYIFGSGTATLADPAGPGSQSAGGSSPFGNFIGGVQGGYEYLFPSRVMLGLEADFSFANYSDLASTLSYRATANNSANEQLEYLASLRGRAGYAFGALTPFVSGGIAWASTRYSRTDLNTGNEDASPSNIRLGWVLGAGIDYRLDQRWSARAEYLYTSLGLTGLPFASGGRYDSSYDLNRVRIGLNYRFGQADDGKKAQDGSGPLDDRGPGTWEIHGQSTFIYQGYGAIPAAYSGPNSFPAEGQARETWTVSAFLGVRLWQGGELYYNPELLQGFGVGNTTGAGAYPNGEAQKSNFPYPRYNTSRLFLRQEFGLGGEREKVESEYGQLAGEKDVSRVTVQVGKYSVKDLFDGNSYAEDPRVDFLNWAMWASAAFDYPADRLGLTWGLTAEINQKRWAARAGYFLVGNEPNANTFDLAVVSRGGWVSELELRYAPYERPGIARLGSWLTATYSGSYSEAVLLSSPLAGLSANDTIAQTRQTRTKYGLYLNLEQALTETIGAFGRMSWNNGQNEISAFTDVDFSVSLGLSIKGDWWNRPDDRIGIGAAFNNISTNHSSYLANGGLGVLVGDGRLNYGAESLFETYYAFQLRKGLVASADYQFLANPGYNTARGPVHFFSGRLRATF